MVISVRLENILQFTKGDNAIKETGYGTLQGAKKKTAPPILMFSDIIFALIALIY